MMRLGRPEQPASTKQSEQSEETVTTEESVTEQPAPGRSTLLDRLKMLWSQKKEKADDNNETKE